MRNSGVRNTLDTVLSQVSVGDDCWEWLGYRTERGYGRIGWRGRQAYTHRLMYELLRGPIGPWLTIDHLCRNTGCQNPWHMEQVTRAENTARSESASSRNRRKTHCPRGHEYTVGARPGGRKERRCKTCNRDYMRLVYKNRARKASNDLRRMDSAQCGFSSNGGAETATHLYF